jgi:hypothetical protein
MTTLKGVLRSYSAAVKRSERINQQHNREAARRFKLQQKIEEAQSANQAVTDWQSYVNVLKTMHLNCTEKLDWNDIINIAKPVEPMKRAINEEVAKFKLEIYKPSFFDNIFGLTKGKLSKLNQLLDQAKAADNVDFKLKHRDFSNELEEWNKLQKIANGVISKDVLAYKNALDYFKPFENLTKLSKRLNFKLNPDYIDVEMEVISESIIPGFELNLTSTGKLSRKDMTISKYNGLNLEHICSSVIRIAKEVSNYFPVNFICVTVIINELNTATGYRVDNIIMSVLMPINKIENLNLESINPIDSVKSFIHNLKFTKSLGFTAVAKIDIENNLLSL